MANILPYQPVSFGKDINNPDECKCSGQPYLQLANFTDDIQFQISNPCHENRQSTLINNGDFGTNDFTDWSFEPSGSSVNWDAITGSAVATNDGGTSGILWQNTSQNIGIDNIYAIKFTVTFGGTGCKLLLVLSDNDMVTYTIIATYTNSGTYQFQYIADKIYTSIGFVFIGDCELSNTLDNIDISYFTLDECMGFCVKDEAGNTVIDRASFLTNSNISYYANYINVTTNWKQLMEDYGQIEGCYKICLCPEDDNMWFYGTNLFTFADNGTCEANTNDIFDVFSVQCAQALTLDPDNTFRGIASAKVFNDGVNTSGNLMTSSDLRLKPNTKYVGVLRYLPIGSTGVNSTVTLVADFPNASLFGAGANDLPNSPGTWGTCYIYFQTGSLYDDTIGKMKLIYTDWNAAYSDEARIDEIQLYEYDELIECSQLFSVLNSHECTSLIQYTNPTNAFGLNFAAPSFMPSLRLSCKIRNNFWQKGEKDTFENSEGNRKIIYSKPRKHKQMIIEEQPEYIHDIINIAFNCETTLIDGVQHIMEDSDYQPNWRKSSEFAPVTIDIRKSEQDLFNNP